MVGGGRRRRLVGEEKKRKQVWVAKLQKTLLPMQTSHR
jgi:hypothetical protein